MSEIESSAAAEPPTQRWFQFSLRTLLIAVTAIGVVLGYAVAYGPGIAIVLGVFTLLTWAWSVRVRRRWKGLVFRQRVYGMLEGSIILTGMVVFIATVATSPSYARQRNALALERMTRNDARFSSIHVEYREPKTKFLAVRGSVHSDRDFDSLRELIAGYDWRNMDGINWHVTIESSGREYDGWDSELFGDEDAKRTTIRSRR